MSQKISAMLYIKNNKKRISVLVVSLSLYLVLLYLTNYILSTGIESFRGILTEDPIYQQNVRLPYEVYGIDTELLETLSAEEADVRIREAEEAFLDKLRQQPEIQDAYAALRLGMAIQGIYGEWYKYSPIGTKENLSKHMELCGATLAEGRLPENAGELIVDERTARNRGMKIGDQVTVEYKLVGIAECERYFGYGISTENSYYRRSIFLFTDGSISDVAAYLRGLGFEIDEEQCEFFDYKNGYEDFNDLVTSATKPAELVYKVILCVITLTLFLVFVASLRERHAQWCLYASIGFSGKAIFYSILREILFCFAVAIGIGAVLTVGGVCLLQNLMVIPNGLAAKPVDYRIMLEILCGYAVVLGLLMLPIRYTLSRIKTVDVIENEEVA